jgi:hypothetical protein
MTDRDMIAVWVTAADDLGIQMDLPYYVGDEHFPVHIPSFGRPAGTLPLWIGDRRSRIRAEAAEHFISMLNPDVYSSYDRSKFIEMLVDWGWFGTPEEMPEWFKQGIDIDLAAGGAAPHP